jgi:DNA repair protein RecO
MSDIEFIQGKNKKTLTDAVKVEKFSGVSQDLEKFKIANGIGEFLNNFIKGEEKDKNIFNLLNEVFYILNDPNLKIKKYSLVYYYFLWNALSLLGYHSEVQRCAGCYEKLIPYSVYFSSKEGGIICGGCANAKKTEGPEQCRKINSDTAKILRIILLKDWQTLSKLKIEQSSQKLLKEISGDYYSYILSSHSFKNILRAKVV